MLNRMACPFAGFGVAAVQFGHGAVQHLLGQAARQRFQPQRAGACEEVRHAQPLDTMHAQLRIDDGRIAPIW